MTSKDKLNRSDNINTNKNRWRGDKLEADLSDYDDSDIVPPNSDDDDMSVWKRDCELSTQSRVDPELSSQIRGQYPSQLTGRKEMVKEEVWSLEAWPMTYRSKTCQHSDEVLSNKNSSEQSKAADKSKESDSFVGIPILPDIVNVESAVPVTTSASVINPANLELTPLDSQTSEPCPHGCSSQRAASKIDGTLTVKLDSLLTSQWELLGALRTILAELPVLTKLSNMKDDTSDLTWSCKKMKTLKDVKRMEKRLRNKQLRKRMVRHLTTVGESPNVGQCVRRMLKSLGSSKLWSNYTPHGRNRKRCFINLRLYKVIMKATAKCHKQATPSEVEKKLRCALRRNLRKNGPSKHESPLIDDDTTLSPEDTDEDYLAVL